MNISWRILVQVTLPAVLIGLLLLGTCLVGIGSINRLQLNRAVILSKDVRSLQAAQEMVICLRQLRFHSFLALLDPVPARAAPMGADHRRFERALRTAGELADLPGESDLIEAIEQSYRRYRSELDLALRRPPSREDRAELLRWADAHPVRDLQASCEHLLEMNQDAMDRTALESEVIGEHGQITLILLGVLGPAGGLIGGFGVAWGLSRSITRLQVRLQDVHAHLDQELGTVRLTGVGDLDHLDHLLKQVAAGVRDIVARSRQQEEELLRGEQLAAVGHLAANVAHEVRNPLTSIKLLVGAALRASPPQPLSADDLRIIHEEVVRVEGKVQSLLDFARPPETHKEPCDLREVVQHSLGLVQPRLRQVGVQLSLQIPDRPIPARVDRGQLGSALGNLLQNALDAMPRGGRLSVRLGQRPPEGIRLEVVDTGPGIDQAVANRLFTPFTSTKPTGTGLGLSISSRVVRAHGGTLRGENLPEGGARFCITLPPDHEDTHAPLAGR